MSEDSQLLKRFSVIPVQMGIDCKAQRNSLWIPVCTGATRLRCFILGLLLINAQILLADDNFSHGSYGLLTLGRGYTNFSADNFSNNPTYSATSWVLAGRTALGFNIDQYIGAEIGGRYFNEQKFSNVQNSGYDGYVNEHAFDAETVLRWPFAKGFNLIGKFGPAYVLARQTLNGSAASVATYNIKGWQPSYALGLSMVLDSLPGISMLAEYSVITADTNDHLPQSELYSLGFIFHF